MVDVPNPICCIFFYQRQVGLHAYSLTLLKWCKSEWSCWSGPWCRDHCRHTGHVRCQPSWANAEQLLPTSFLHSSSSSSSTQSSSSSSASSSSAAAASSASSGTTVVTPTRWIWTVRHCTGPRQVWDDVELDLPMESPQLAAATAISCASTLVQRRISRSSLGAEGLGGWLWKSSNDVYRCVYYLWCKVSW